MTHDPNADWRATAETVDLFSLSDFDPFEGIDVVYKPTVIEILTERAGALSQAELVQAIYDDRFGRYVYHFSDLVDPPERWGIRDRDDDVKPLTKALKGKDTPAQAVASAVLVVAQRRFDAAAAPGGPRYPAYFRTDKTRNKLLSAATDGAIEIPVGQRSVFSPFKKELTAVMAAIAPLPVVAPRTKDKVDYRAVDGDKTKTASASYAERWMTAWAARGGLAYRDAAGSAAITPAAEHVLLRNKPWTIWGAVPKRGIYLAVNKSANVQRFVLHTASQGRYLTGGLEQVLAPHKGEAPPAVSIHDWAAMDAEAQRDVFFADLPADARGCWQLDAAVLAELYASGGFVNKRGDLQLPNADFATASTSYSLNFADRMYRDVTDARPGAYHQLAYSDQLQASLCIHADDTSGDPVVYDIDHENWLRGTFGTLGRIFPRELHPRR